MSRLSEFSNSLAAAVEKGGAGTLSVDARRRYPASGIAYATDLVLTADHVVTRDEDLAVSAADGKAHPVTIAGRDPGSDLALLRLTEKFLPPASKLDSGTKVSQLVLET